MSFVGNKKRTNKNTTGSYKYAATVKRPPHVTWSHISTPILFKFIGLTTPNASPFETHVNCFNSAGRIHHISPL